MSQTVEIRGTDGLVRIEVVAYERPDATDINVLNWLTCKCSVEAREFACNLNLSLRTHDFVHFRAQLNEALEQLRGTVVINASEERFRLEVIISPGGHVDIFGYAQSSAARPSTTMLTFSFEGDVSFLPETNREVEKILQHFPVRWLD
jgi:hypothetical protein